MPLYDFQCPKCGRVEMYAPVGTAHQRHDCGRKALRLFTPTLATIVPEYMKAGSDTEGRRRHQAWIDKPETQAKLKSGEYEIANGNDLP